MLTDIRNLLVWEAQAKAGRVPLLLIRHGQTAWNKERRFLGRTDIPLDEEGRRQARAAGDWMAPIPFAALYASPLSRAQETATLVSEGRRELPFHTEDDLTELNQGELEGQKGHTLPEKYPEFFDLWMRDPTDARVPGGESMRECQARAVGILTRLVGAHPPGPPVAVVSHKMFISSFICAVLGLPLRHYRLIGQKNTAINLLSLGEDGFQLHHLNQALHLGERDTPPPIPA